MRNSENTGYVARGAHALFTVLCFKWLVKISEVFKDANKVSP